MSVQGFAALPLINPQRFSSEHRAAMQRREKKAQTKRRTAAAVLPKPPEADAIERVLLGSLLEVPERVLDIIDQGLQPMHFRQPNHRKVFEAMMTLSRQDVVPTRPAVKQELKNVVPQADVEDLVDAVDDLIDAVTHGKTHLRDAPDIQNYATIVMSAAVNRDHQKTALQILHDINENVSPDAIERLMSDAILRRDTDAEIKPAYVVAKQAVQEIDEQAERGAGVIWETGFAPLDRYCRMRAGGLYVIGARPSTGKTALGQQLTTSMAAAGKRGLYVSLEMDATRIMGRMVASVSTIPVEAIAMGGMNEQQRHVYAVQALRIGQLPFSLYYQRGMTAEALFRKVQRLKRRERLDFVAVDYLQKLQTETWRKGMTAQERIAEVTEQLCTMAERCDVAVVCLAQLNRDVESRPKKRPTMADLRESGAPENDADLVGLLYRPPTEDNLPDPHRRMELIIEKNRDGRTGFERIQFNPTSASFEGFSDSERDQES